MKQIAGSASATIPVHLPAQHWSSPAPKRHNSPSGMHVGAGSCDVVVDAVVVVVVVVVVVMVVVVVLGVVVVVVVDVLVVVVVHGCFSQRQS